MPSIVNKRGQAVIPKRIRDRFDLKPGCKIEWEVNQAGEILLRKLTRNEVERLKQTGPPDREAARLKRMEETRRLSRRNPQGILLNRPKLGDSTAT
jgi:AbrB family looped-hinge helix DNA binding protein